jgi:hypothetical protein
LNRLTEDKQKDTAPPPQHITEQQTAEQSQQEIKKGLLDELVEGQDSAERQKSGDNGGEQLGE